MLTTTLFDPRSRGPQPPFQEPKQPFPGLEAAMRLKPDHGEATYAGAGRLTRRKALITGGDSGIGAAVALAFAREGAKVVINHLPDEQPDADALIAKADAEGAIISIPGDIRQEAFCQELVQQTVDQLGGIDILVNNAAYQMAVQNLDDITEELLERTYRTNIYSMFFLVKAAVPHMPAGSSIINTSSVQSYDPSAILLPYATTKAAITNFTKGLSLMLIKQGIRVNAVAPGPIWSPLNPMAMPSVEKFGAQSPMGRPGQPAELAPVYVFLASSEASYVSGAIYEVTGGEFTG